MSRLDTPVKVDAKSREELERDEWAWAHEAAKEQAEQFRRDAEDDEAMKRAFAGTESCSSCSGHGIDGEECSDGYHGGGPCPDCHGTGRIAVLATTGAQA